MSVDLDLEDLSEIETLFNTKESIFNDIVLSIDKKNEEINSLVDENNELNQSIKKIYLEYESIIKKLNDKLQEKNNILTMLSKNAQKKK